MHFYFIRHAQSVNNALWSNTGSDQGRNEDPDITDLGVQQAHALADFLSTADPRGGSRCNGRSHSGFQLTHIYTSLMLRAIKTGSIIADHLGLPLEGLTQIHERGGIYLENHAAGQVECLPGKDRAYFEANFPKFSLPSDFIDTGWWDRRPVETPEECQQRAERFYQALLEKHGGTDDKVAIVSHGGFYNDFLWTMLNLAPPNQPWFLMYNTAITRIEFHQRADRDQEVLLAYQNRVEHLSPDMVT